MEEIVGQLSVLHPLSKLPELNSAAILLVGTPAIDKQALAQTLVNLSRDFSLHVRTAAQLPLPATNDDQRPNIDLVVIMLDANVKLSMKVVADSVKHLDAAYFLGHVCFVALNAVSEQSHYADLGDVAGLCDAYDSPLLCASLETVKHRECLARRILEMTRVAAGFKPGISPLLIKATKQSYQFVEAL